MTALTRPLGVDRGLFDGVYVQFSEGLDVAQNARLHALHRALMADLPVGVTDVCPGYVNVFVEFDAAVISRVAVLAWLQAHLAALPETAAPMGRDVTVHVRYDGPDLEDVAARTGLDVSGVIAAHTATAYHVYAVGFTPGFPFMGEVTEALRLPRRSTPRPLVPFNAVAVANAQTCVYPLPSPGGWNLLGTALDTIYDPNRASPFLLAPGDRVTFAPQDGPTPTLPAIRELWPAAPRVPVLRVEEAGLLDLLVDGGRPRQGHWGLARSGPLDAVSADAANALVGNPPGTPLLELTLRGPVLTALRDVVVAVAGFGLHPDGHPTQTSVLWRAGETLRFTSTRSGARAYLAVAGGIEAAPFLGSASVDVIGRVGRPLRAGDVLGLAREASALPGFAGVPLTLPASVTLRLRPGPQATPEALHALCSAPFRVGGLDRMGLRLDGPAVPGGQVTSEATPPGAVQVTPAGEPIVLLADRGRLGGYAKPAVVHPLDLPLAAQVRPGQHVTFHADLSGTPEDWARHWTVPAALPPR